MNQTFQDNLELFLVEQIESILLFMREEDKKYQKILTDLNKARDTFEPINNGLSEESQNRIDDYISCMYASQAYENSMIYLHGYKDCFKLLFLLGVFGKDGE